MSTIVYVISSERARARECVHCNVFFAESTIVTLARGYEKLNLLWETVGFNKVRFIL